MTSSPRRVRLAPPVTPDGRYLVLRGRLWRRADPALTDDAREALVRELMDARRAVGRALRSGDPAARRRGPRALTRRPGASAA